MAAKIALTAGACLLATAGTAEAAPVVTQSTGSSSASSNLLVGVALGIALVSMVIGIGAALRGRRHDKLADFAFTDSLTGLRNRRRMDADVAEQAALATRPTATLMIDVDHFKQFNDSYGHTMGDEVLRMVGSTLAQHFRKTDVPYRYGGEEFCVLLPETTEAEAMLAGERIRAAVEAIDLPVDEHITVSIGVSIGPASQISDTLERADGALYAAKEGGRNRVALA